MKPPKNGTPQLYCQPDVIAGMKKIWGQSGNGMNGTEASFNVNGSPGNYSLFFNPFTNQQQSQSFRLQANTFANFHVHPNSSSWQPSTPSNNATGNGLGDVGMANRTGIQIHVVSRQGLGFYDPKTKLAPVRLRPGMDWSKPCGG